MTRRHRYQEEFKRRALQKLSTCGKVRKLGRTGGHAGKLVNWKRQAQQLDHLNRLLDLERQTNEFHRHTHRRLRTSQRILQEQAQYIEALQHQIESLK